MTGSARRLAAGALAAVLGLAACASSADLRPAPPEQAEQRSSAPSPDRDDERPAAVPEPEPKPKKAPQQPRPDTPRPGPTMPLPNVVGRVAFFTLPSGNIGCQLVATEARCDIAEHDYRLPRAPAACDLSYGRAVSIVVGAPEATFVCHGDTVLGARRTLQYGESTVVGDVGCTSSEEGVYCYDLRSGRGFQLQRASARFF